MSNITLGAYSPFTNNITTEDKSVFVDALENFVGVSYEPLAVATQLVCGTNYAFFCNATPIYPGAISTPTMVSIYKSNEGRASITHIEKISY